MRRLERDSIDTAHLGAIGHKSTGERHVHKENTHETAKHI